MLMKISCSAYHVADSSTISICFNFGGVFLMRKYVVRIESEAAPGTHSYFPPVSLEFPEPLSFGELSRLQTILRDSAPDRIDLRLSRALARMSDEFSLQGRVVDYAVSAKILA